MNSTLLSLFLFLQLICAHPVNPHQHRPARELVSFNQEQESERHHLVSHPFADQGDREDGKEGEDQTRQQNREQNRDDNRNGENNRERKRPSLQSPSLQNPSPSNPSLSKNGNQEEMGSHWHLYFGMMIVSTLLGLKILGSWEQRVNLRIQESPQARSRHQELCQELEDTRSGPT